MEIVRKTLGQMLNHVGEKYPNKDALVHTEIGVRYNYSLLLWEVNRVAKGMIKMGIGKGDRVILWAPNIPEWIITQMALAKIGAILVPVDPGAGREDFHYILGQSEASTIIMARGLEDEEYVHMVLSERDYAPHLENMVVVSDKSYPEMTLWTELTAEGDDLDTKVLEEMENKVEPEDPIAIMYTSGTTGNPKGVVLDHLGLINKSIFSTKRQGLDSKDRLCLFFPLFHMFGNTCITMAGMLTGAAMIMACQSFDPQKVLHAIHKEQCTAIYASPSMVIALVDHPEFNKKRWKSLRKGIIGGSPCPMELMKKLVQDIGISQIMVAYGITEASSWITMTKPDDPLQLRVSTIGTPLPCNQVKIINPDTGEDLPPNTQGELCVRGLLMKEYFKMPAATAAAIDKDGWFHSGDLGEMDERAYVRITGRLKDVIIRDGVEIHPTEVEEVIYRLPEVSEVQVFGFPHPEKGQEIGAWVKLKEGADLSLESLVEYTKSEVDVKKQPRHYKFVTDFPMTRSGKVQKFKLAEMAQMEYLET